MIDVTSYNEWIKQKDLTKEQAYGACYKTCVEMQAVFPELILTKGYYLCYRRGVRNHWWLKTEDGQVIDPTKNQFPSNGIGFYQEFEENEPIPTGKCHNCGDFCYNNDFCCSENCTISYAAYCQRPWSY